VILNDGGNKAIHLVEIRGRHMVLSFRFSVLSLRLQTYRNFFAIEVIFQILDSDLFIMKY
jgi:hypothetical protein